MSETKKSTLRNAVVSAAISAVVTILIAALTLAATYGRLTEQTAQIGRDVDRLVASVDSMQKLNTTMCERIASLEAQIRIYQTGKGGSP